MATLALTAIVGIGLNVLLGLTGQVSFGHVGFYAIGAYTVAILTTTREMQFWLALPAAVALSRRSSAHCSRCPRLRVRGPYLAMVTIAFGFVVENGAVEWRGLTGGQNGIMGVPTAQLFGASFGERGVALLVHRAVRARAVRLRAARARRRGARRCARCKIPRSPPNRSASIRSRSKRSRSRCPPPARGSAGALFAPLSGFVTPSTLRASCNRFCSCSW